MSLQRARLRGAGAGRDFREVLKRFKYEGCNLLVTGAVPEDVTAHATRTLLGAADADRKRIVALTNPRPGSVADRLPRGVAADDPDVVVVDSVTRRHSTPPAVHAAESELRAPDDADDLARLRHNVVHAIEYFERDDGLAPSQLRLSVSSLDRLLGEHGLDPVVEFLDSASAAVNGARGMAHYHLPRPDEEVPDDLTSLFDARIELRTRERRPTEQRWHVPEYDQTTQWVEL